MRRTVWTALLLTVVLFACAAVMAGCASRQNDADTIQGEWQVSGSNMTCVITNNQIRMPKETNYDYTLDETNGKITYSVGNVSGTADYVFGKDSSGNVTLMLTEYPDGNQVITTFVKISDNTNATPTLGGSASTPTTGITSGTGDGSTTGAAAS